MNVFDCVGCFGRVSYHFYMLPSVDKSCWVYHSIIQLHFRIINVLIQFIGMDEKTVQGFVNRGLSFHQIRGLTVASPELRLDFNNVKTAFIEGVSNEAMWAFGDATPVVHSGYYQNKKINTGLPLLDLTFFNGEIPKNSVFAIFDNGDGSNEHRTILKNLLGGYDFNRCIPGTYTNLTGIPERIAAYFYTGDITEPLYEFRDSDGIRSSDYTENNMLSTFALTYMFNGLVAEVGVNR